MEKYQHGYRRIKELTQILKETPQHIIDKIKKNSSDVSDYTRKLAVRTFINGKIMFKRYDYYLGVVESKDNDFYREHEKRLIKLGIAETYRTKFNIGFYRSVKTWLRIIRNPKIKVEPTSEQYVAYWFKN